MLFGADLGQFHALPLSHLRQEFFIPVMVAGLVPAFQIHPHKARVGDSRAVGPEKIARATGQIHGHRVNRGVLHLARHGPLPDQFVQLELFRA